MFRRFAATVALTLVLPASALAGGGNYAFDGATPAERATVRAALNASAFDWSIVPQRVTIHVGEVGTSHARPGHIWLDRGLLAAGRFAWATVMDEYAHQVDFSVLDEADLVPHSIRYPHHASHQGGQDRSHYTCAEPSHRSPSREEPACRNAGHGSSRYHF